MTGPLDQQMLLSGNSFTRESVYLTWGEMTDLQSQPQPKITEKYSYIWQHLLGLSYIIKSKLYMDCT